VTLDSLPSSYPSETMNYMNADETSSLPPLVGLKTASEILGVTKVTLLRWLRPGSGKGSASFGPDKTYMVPPARAGSRPVWAREDVERFALEFGRQRAPKR
jgi:hypothetical protein